MKKIALILSLLFVFAFKQDAEAQFLKRLQRRVQNSVENKVSRKIEDAVDDEVDKILDGEDEEKKKKSKKSKDNDSEKSSSEESNAEYSTVDDDKEETNASKKEKTSTNDKKKKATLFRKFKYIPGEQVIFNDDLKFEETGEFPSRWDLKAGGAEVAMLNGEKVILTTTEHNNIIFPLFDKPDYLEDEFTIDLDVYLDALKGINDWQEFDIGFFNDDTDLGSYSIYGSRIEFDFRTGSVQGRIIDKKKDSDFKLEEAKIKPNDWNHISISYHKGKLKVYLNEHRIANLPNFKSVEKRFYINIEPAHLDEKNDNSGAIKNIRIAHGGGQMYKRIMADGKYVTNGILFDSGKAFIKPQSYGIINKMANILKEQPDWKFEIIGHTDSDGDDSSNLKLSKDRAEAVKQAIISYGIKANRLSTVGKGENEPLNNNASTEEKANNRRVEFIRNTP